MPLPNKSQRDKDIEAALGPAFRSLRHCVFVNCSRSLPDLRTAYPTGTVPRRALEHAICQSWRGIAQVCTKDPPREVVFAHDDGIIKYVVQASDWLEVHDKRVIFTLVWLPPLHPLLAAVATSIRTAIGHPHPTHSAFLYK